MSASRLPARSEAHFVADGLQRWMASGEARQALMRRYATLDRRVCRWCRTRRPLGGLKVWWRRRRIRRWLYGRYIPIYANFGHASLPRA